MSHSISDSPEIADHGDIHPSDSRHSEGARGPLRAIREGDLAVIHHWHTLWNQPWPGNKAFPATGMIIPGVAAGFLVKTETSWALLEGFITNKEADAASRNNALDDITLGLMAMAKDQGYTGIVALLSDESIARRASRHGLKDIGLYRMMTRGI